MAESHPSSAPVNLTECGVYVLGVVLHTRAVLIRPRKGGELVKVVCELGTLPGTVDVEQYFDPAKDERVKVEGDQVTLFPTLPQFERILLRATRYRIYDERLVVTKATRNDPTPDSTPRTAPTRTT